MNRNQKNKNNDSIKSMGGNHMAKGEQEEEMHLYQGFHW